MRKFLALALVVVMMLALIPTAFAATTFVGGGSTQFIFGSAGAELSNDGTDGFFSTTMEQKLGWAPYQNLDGVWVQLVDAKDTLRIDAAYSNLALRGGDYVPYIDIPMYINFDINSFVRATSTNDMTGKITVIADGFSQTLAIPFGAGYLGSSSASGMNFNLRFYPKQLGNSTDIRIVYEDGDTTLSTNFWTPVGSSTASTFVSKKIIYIDRNTTTMNGNAIVPSIVGTNANQAKAVWAPATDNVRVFANYGDFVKTKIYNQDDGKEYILLDVKLQFMQNDGVTPYPGNTPCKVELNPQTIQNMTRVSKPVGTPSTVKIAGNEYFVETLWENDRPDYLDKNGAITVRFGFGLKTNDPTKSDCIDVLKKLADTALAKPRVYLRDAVTGVYTEKYFSILSNYSYYIAPATFQIAGGDFTMKVGETKSLSIVYGDTYTLDKNVAWYSSDANVASVSPATTAYGASVTVTAKKAGVAVINARNTISAVTESFVLCTVVDDTVVAPDATTVPYVVVCNALNKRVGAGTSFGKSAPTLKRGEVVDVIEVVGGWAKYEIGGKTFYSSLGDGKYLQPK